uniref:dolichyl-phosphate-mannose--protein mannosyltransferase n=1 Tax=Globisporangium ultimum (strain ATCC 200006 / CBS 805.95 / DAOM BR144) TaxID=431595 RepID=K3WA60_GLOUD
MAPWPSVVTSSFLIAAAAMAAVWNAHENGFVWDDRAAILGNKDVHSGGNGTALWNVFANDFWGTPIVAIDSHKSYRPLAVLSFRMNHLLTGYDARYFHAVNTLVHAGCSLLVWKVANVLFAATKKHAEGTHAGDAVSSPDVNGMGALLAGLLFAVHPIHCDAIASVVGRADLLCTLLALQSFLIYVDAVESSRWTAVGLALITAVGASLCKELGFTAFGLFVAYDVIFYFSSQYSADDREGKIKRIRVIGQRIAVVTVFVLLFAVVRVWINGEHRQMKWTILANNVVVQRSKFTRMLSYAHIHAWYLWKLVWPRSLCFDYGFKTVPVITTIWDPLNLYTLAAYSVVLVGVVVGIKQIASSPLLMCIAFGVIPFIPASNLFFPVGTVVAERLLYFPSVGFCLLIGLKVQDALAISYNRLRNAEWASETSLFEAAVKIAPMNNKVLSNVGKTLLHHNNELAIKYLRVATAILPHQIEGHTNIGLAYWAQESWLLATRHLYKSTHFGPMHFQGTGYFGAVLLDTWLGEGRALGRMTKDFLRSPTIQNANQYLERAISMGSTFPMHYYTRSRIAYFEGEYEDAIRFSNAALQVNEHIHNQSIDKELIMNPGQIYNMIAVSYMAQGKKDLALKTILAGLEVDPSDIDLHINAAIIYVNHNQLNEGNQHVEAGLQSATPKHVPILHTAAELMEEIHQLDAAAAFRQRAKSLLASRAKKVKILRAT